MEYEDWKEHVRRLEQVKECTLFDPFLVTLARRAMQSHLESVRRRNGPRPPPLPGRIDTIENILKMLRG